MVVWKRITDERAGYLFSLSESLALLEWRQPGVLMPHTDSEMMIASDYSGQHKGSTHESFSFLVTTRGGLERWFNARLEFRERWLPDGRRMSFKELREPMRRKALPAFLATADAIHGTVLTFLVHRSIGSFVPGGPSAAQAIFPDCFSKEMRPTTIEKMIRIASFLAFILAGFRLEKQPCLWISDDDEALENFGRRDQLGRLSSYLSIGLTGWRQPADLLFGTASSADAPVWAEDAVAIPDLVAGATCKLTHIFPRWMGSETWHTNVSKTVERDARAREIGDWIATSRGRLRSVLLRLEPDDEGNARASAQLLGLA